MKNIEKKLEYLRERIEKELRTLLSNEDAFAAELYNMIYYHLGWMDAASTPVKGSSGKMLRPLFGLLCCEAVEGDSEKALPAVAAVELLHNFSLIHDDIQDDSSVRQGRETVWAVWGKPQAINAGDALFTIARNALLKTEERANSARAVLESIRSFDETCMALCMGQYIDMNFEKLPAVDIDDYLQMVKLKTGSLWGLSGYLGVFAATEDREKAETFRRIGENIGIAFQIQDDILGVWGEKEITGKTENDLQRRKKSLPLVHALNATGTPQAARLSRLCQKEAITREDILQMKQLMEGTGSKDFCVSMGERYSDEAKSILTETTGGSMLETLIMLIRRMIGVTA